MANSAMQLALSAGKAANTKAVLAYFAKWAVFFALIWATMGKSLVAGLATIMNLI